VNRLIISNQPIPKWPQEPDKTIPPTSWGYLSPRTMADPCPQCGGTEYYCAHVVDLVLSRDGGDFDKVMQALAELYEEWCRVMRESPDSSEIHYYSSRLMDAYNRWLG